MPWSYARRLAVLFTLSLAVACPAPGDLPALSTSLASASSAAAEGVERNGFRLEPASVPVTEILSGGPPRDGIPALDAPAHLPASAADWDDEEMVLGVAWNGEARAYPVAILVWHELVNDSLGGRPLLVSYCPLCGTGIVFDRRVAGHERRFGVSGLLFRSDLLMFDRESESLWSQISAEAVTGAARGSRLTLLRSRMTRWADWRARHPETTVLSRETGLRSDYGRSPYDDYATREDLYFPVDFDRRYHPKMPTLGLRIPGGESRAYPALELARAGGTITEPFAGTEVTVAYDPDRQLFRFEAPIEIEAVEGYWFAWTAFHPDTSVFESLPGEAPPTKNQPQ